MHNTSGYLAQNMAQASPSKTQSTPAPNAPQHPGDRHRHHSQVSDVSSGDFVTSV